MMSKHLDQKSIENYRRGTMSPAELLFADEHLANCEDCLNRAENSGNIRSILSAFETNIPATKFIRPDHLAYEQLADYVDDKLGKVEKEIADVHLAVCRVCEEDLKALRALNETPLISAEKHSLFTQWIKRLFAFSPEKSFFSQPFIPLASAALVLLFAGGLFWSFLQTQSKDNSVVNLNAQSQEKEIAEMSQHPIVTTADESDANRINETTVNANETPPVLKTPDTKIVAALNDNGNRITLDEKGNLSGLENLASNYRQAVENALKTQNLEISSEAKELKRKTGTLMSGKTEGVSFAVLTPVGKVIQSARPEFRWQPLEGATAYTVNIYDTNFNKVASSEPLSKTNWSPPSPLKRGTVYLWQVTAIKDGEEIKSPTLPAPEARFKVLDKTGNDEIENAKRTNRSRLLQGILYAKAGLTDEAEREFNALLKENPKSEVAGKLLRKLRSAK